MSQSSTSPAIPSRRKKLPYPPPSPRRRTKNKSKFVTTLKRCSSAPLLSQGDNHEEDVDLVGHNYSFGIGKTLFRPQTFSNAFVSSPSLFASSPKIFSNEMKRCYDKEAKVVVNVTVEGSSGPIRTMVKLGSTVEDVIRHVVDKYREEGRSPIIESNLASSFQLHLSYFSLQGLDKSEVIGELSSRSLYLRKSNGESTLNSFRSESNHNLAKHNFVSLSSNTPGVISSFIARKINKIVRRAHRLWNFVVCSQ